jgi:hypothetical protein
MNATPEHFPDAIVASGFQMPTWIRTYSGAAFHIPRPRPSDIVIEDIAHGLAIAPRWGGQSRVRYPVVAHCIYVAEMLPDYLKFDGLMHDNSEAYFCDLPAPFKKQLPQYKVIENEIMQVISRRYGFNWPPPDLVKTADAISLYDERAALFTCPVGEDVPAIHDYTGLTMHKDWDFESWEQKSTKELKTIFLDLFYEYRDLRPGA